MYVSDAAETTKSELPFCGVLSLFVFLQPSRPLCCRSALYILALILLGLFPTGASTSFATAGQHLSVLLAAPIALLSPTQENKVARSIDLLLRFLAPSVSLLVHRPPLPRFRLF